MTLATRLREAALIGHTHPEHSGLAQLLTEAAKQIEEAEAIFQQGEAALDQMSEALDQSLAKLQPMVQVAEELHAKLGDGTKVMAALAALKDNADRFTWLRDHATVQWQLCYTKVEVTFLLDIDSFAGLSDAVDLARGAPQLLPPAAQGSFL